MSNEEDDANIAGLAAQYTSAVSCFFSQDPNYTLVKKRVAQLCLTGQDTAGAVMINVVIATLEVGECLTPLTTKELS